MNLSFNGPPVSFMHSVLEELATTSREVFDTAWQLGFWSGSVPGDLISELRTWFVAGEFSFKEVSLLERSNCSFRTFEIEGAGSTEGLSEFPAAFDKRQSLTILVHFP